MSLPRLLLISSVLLSAGSLCAATPFDLPVPVTGGNVGNDYVVDCNNVFAPGSAATYVQLDGSGSYDPDGTPVTFLWFEECPYGYFPDPTSPTPVYVMDMTGQCSRSCLMELRVTSGGQLVKKQFRVTVQDATPPVIAPVADVVGIWGDSTAAQATGVPVASDNCDPAPLISFTEVNLTAPGVGVPELVLERTWTATDCMGFQSSTTQRITLLSPTANGGNQANLDFDPANCPNSFSAAQTGTVDVLLLGGPNFDVTKVIPGTLRLALRTNPTVTISLMGTQLKDIGSITALNYGDCNSSTLDGKRDLRIKFNRTLIATQLGLASVPSGTSVDLVLTGRMTTGKFFATRDRVTIQ